MSIYKLNKAKYGTHQIVTRLVGQQKTVLDVGCNEGFLTETKAPTGNKYYGIDFDRESLEVAKNRYYRTYEIDLNNIAGVPFCHESFDVIVFSDILEHLNEPEKVLDYFVRNFLKENGKVIISLPNVAHYSTRLALLLGKFEYTDSGILDRTHLHLYTRDTARKLILSSGLRIAVSKYSSNTFGLLIEKLPFLGPLLGFNLIFKCRKS